jgi:hypothetical protein
VSTTPAINGKIVETESLRCCLHSYNDFLHNVHLRSSQADLFATVSSLVLDDTVSPVSLLPAISDRQCRCYRR